MVFSPPILKYYRSIFFTDDCVTKQARESLLLQNKQNIVFFIIYHQGYPLGNASTLILSIICEQYISTYIYILFST